MKNNLILTFLYNLKVASFAEAWIENIDDADIHVSDKSRLLRGGVD